MATHWESVEFASAGFGRDDPGRRSLRSLARIADHTFRCDPELSLRRPTPNITPLHGAVGSRPPEIVRNFRYSDPV
ncbi:MAG: hypothetical protein EA381_17305 [Planctomycetaceae bacterium]|nr:MAG: hypothetical protein EA381_17305 [Planctomycetaceae bacterium]